MKTFRWLAATALTIAAVPLAAQSTATFSTERLSQHVQTLGSDAFEGRAPATAGETKTVAYLSDQFAKAGLQPGGDVVNGKRQWTQAVPLLKSEWQGAPQINVDIAGKATALTQGEQIAVRAPTNGEKGLAIADAPLVFVGYGVKAPERGWDDFKGQDMRGKIMVVLVNDPDFEGGEGDFGGKAMTYYGRWTYKYEEGARQGAKGVLVIHETEPASYGWATVKNSNTNAMFDIVRKDPAAEHPPLEGWIQRDLAAQLFAASGTSFEAMKAAAKRKDFQPVPLKATLDLRGSANTEVITSRNVLGIVRGSKYPDETVIYTGHWDHLGIGEPDDTGDRIYNGAIDNGTGIAHLIEQARAFARGPRPERSVVFLAVTAEEKGLLGSEYYAANPIYPAAKTAGVINTDVMSVLGPARDFTVRGNQKFGLLDMLIEEAAKRGRRFTPDPHPETGGFFRSDHFTMAKVGIPALSFSPGQDLVNGGVARAEAWSKMYTDKMYHQPADEYSPDWDFTGVAQDAELLHAVGWRLANSRDWPNWSEDSEFRAKRDESAAERGSAAPKKGQRG
ncbi:MAG TPA: M28 family metallopeptidase [Sphingomicrobium sp.]|nr:M28 family metallopeptidase [Sphingomicrobium sp.]